MSITDKILEKIDIVEFISNYVNLEKAGSNYKGLSPFKEENTPSFVVSPNKKIFKDFSSNLGGNAIKFYSLIKNISYNEALIELAGIYGINLGNYNKHKDKNSKYYNQLNLVKDHYLKNLNDSNIAIKYLQNRGYDFEDIKKYNLGYANKDFKDLVDKFDNEILLELGILSEKNNNIYNVFIDRIIFPIYNLNKQIVGFGARDISENENTAKYLNSKETHIFKKSNELFGIYDSGEKIKNYNNIILVEGFFDVLRLHKNNIVNSVATLGTSLTQNQAKLISKLTKNIVIAYDDDKAGMEAKIRSIYILNKFGFNIKIMSLLNLAKDPDELILKYDKYKFIELFKDSVDAFDFLYQIYSKDYDMKKSASKTLIIEKFKTYFSTISDIVYFDRDLKKLSDKINISYDILKNKFKYNKNYNIDNEIKIENKKIKINNKDLELEKKVILLLLNEEKIRDDFKNFEYSDKNKELIQKIINGNFENNLNEKEREIILDINLELGNLTINKKNIENVYKDLVKKFIENSLYERLELLYDNNTNNMTDKQFIKHIYYNNQLKNIYNINMIEAKELFESYFEYIQNNN